METPCVTAFPLLNGLITHYGGIANHFRQKCPRFQDFAYTVSNCRSGGGGDPLPSAPGDWTQTPISAWLASVPIVSVSRNDHTVYVRFSLKVCGSILTRRLLERNFDAKLRNQQQCFVASKNNATQGSDVSVTLLSKTSHATGAR